MVQAVPRKPFMIVKPLYHFIDTGITHWLSNVVHAMKNMFVFAW